MAKEWKAPVFGTSQASLATALAFIDWTDSKRGLRTGTSIDCNDYLEPFQRLPDDWTTADLEGRRTYRLNEQGRELALLSPLGRAVAWVREQGGEPDQMTPRPQGRYMPWRNPATGATGWLERGGRVFMSRSATASEGPQGPALAFDGAKRRRKHG